MSKKLKCYLAHPYNCKDSEDKKKIMSILEERRVDVLDPFLAEGNLLKKYGAKEYYSGPYHQKDAQYKLGREIWINDLIRVRKCDMILAWLPYPSIGTAAELFEAFIRGKFIQIISPMKHPLFAYVTCGGNQQFETVHDFDKLRKFRW